MSSSSQASPVVEAKAFQTPKEGPKELCSVLGRAEVAVVEVEAFQTPKEHPKERFPVLGRPEMTVVELEAFQTPNEGPKERCPVLGSDKTAVVEAEVFQTLKESLKECPEECCPILGSAETAVVEAELFQSPKESPIERCPVVGSAVVEAEVFLSDPLWEFESPKECCPILGSAETAVIEVEVFQTPKESPKERCPVLGSDKTAVVEVEVFQTPNEIPKESPQECCPVLGSADTAVVEAEVFLTPNVIPKESPNERCPVLGSAETACLSPIRSSKEPLLVETCEDEGYITRSFTQDLNFTPVISTPLRVPKKETGSTDPDVLVTSCSYNIPITEFCLDETEYTWESTLLNVQVKSKVVAVPKRKHLCESSSEEADLSLAAPFKVGRRITPPAHKRPRGVQYPDEWQEDKHKYMQAVTQHIHEKPKGVMNELMDLMNTVASEAAPWQHPSDLTTRNFQPGNQGKSLYTLEEWKEKNGGSFRRFADV